VIRNALTYLVVVAIFGVAVPYSKGLGFFDPVFLGAYACLGIIFAGPAATHAFETRPASLAQAIQWILRAALFGELIAVVMLGCGIGTVYATSRGYVFAPDLETLAYSISLGAAGSLALASLAAWVTVQISATASRMALRAVFLLLLAGFYFEGRWLPNVARTGTILCLLAAPVFVVLLRLRLGRASVS